MEEGKITQTEWAREIGVSKQYVCYLVKKGIVELEDGLIDREQANEAVAAIRDPSQPLRRKGGEIEEKRGNVQKSVSNRIFSSTQFSIY